MKNKNQSILEAGITVKTMCIFLVAILLMSAGTFVIGATETHDKQSVYHRYSNYDFEIPEITDDGLIEMEGTFQTTLDSDKEMLPIYIQTFELPFGAIVGDIEVVHSEIQTLILSTELKQGPVVKPLLIERDRPFLNGISSLFRKRMSNQNSQLSESDSEKTTLISPGNTYETYPFCQIDKRVGRNMEGKLATFVVARILPCEIIGNTLRYVTEVNIDLSYSIAPSATSSELSEEYDLLIISADAYISTLQPLVQHKEDMGLKTKLVSLSDIYNKIYFDEDDYLEEPIDEQEEIKYFIYNAIKKWDVTYVLAAGGYRTFFGLNIPSKQFPIRYSRLDDGAEPGYACDQYYSCCLAYDEIEGVVFDSCDSNGNNIPMEWNRENGYDAYDEDPDAYFGRLPFRNKFEAKTVVDEIIYYEKNTYNQDWFKSNCLITGDGFQDLNMDDDLSFDWNTTLVPEGQYTIFAQSRLQDDPLVLGPIDKVQVTVDPTAPSRVTFHEYDHLPQYIEPLDEEQETLYPAKPVAHIVVPSNQDVLGHSNVDYNPPEAYCSDNWHWGHVQYADGVLKIRGKSYDPSHQETGDRGSHTEIKYWINNSDNETIAESNYLPSNIFYEGEIECDRAADYMSDFEQTKLYSSNGNWYTMWDVIKGFSQGHGFVYFAGHGNPMSWGDHLPGIPGGRDDGMINGMKVINLDFGLARYESEEEDPPLPMDRLTNGHKKPVVLVGGCHNAYIDASFMKLFYDAESVLFTVLHGGWVPECFNWWLARMPQGGAIATIGCSGLGYGRFGAAALSGLGGWINPEFFRIYSQEGCDILGETFTQTLISYSNNFDTMGSQTDRKTFEEWVLIGDPSLKIGGYPPEGETSILSDPEEIQSMPKADNIVIEKGKFDLNNVLEQYRPLSSDEYKITYNEGLDCSPQGIFFDGEDYLVGYEYESPTDDRIHPGFAYSNGGVLWKEFVYGTPTDSGYVSFTTYLDDEDEEQYLGSICFDAESFGAIHISDFSNPSSWATSEWGFSSGDINSLGLTGMAVTGYDNGHVGGMWDCIWQDNDAVMYMFEDDDYVHGLFFQCKNFDGDVDDTTGRHFWVTEKEDGGGIIMKADPPNTYDYFEPTGFSKPNVAVHDGCVYIAYESGASVKCYRSTDNGENWEIKTITSTGSDPKIMINEDGSVSCYYVLNNKIHEAKSTNHGSTWASIGQISDVIVDTTSYSPFSIIQECLVYAKDDGDLYAELAIDTTGVMMKKLQLNDFGYVLTEITNSGTTDITYFDWEIVIDGASPLGRYFGLTGTIFEQLLKGKVLNGDITTDYVVILSSGETLEIISGPVFGLGHVTITARVIDSEDNVLAEQSEDGFLIGGRILMYHGEE